MKKSIFFGEIQHLEGACSGEYETTFAALRRLGIEGFQFSDRGIAHVGEERLLHAMRSQKMEADVIHTVIPLLSEDDTVFRAAVSKAVETLSLLRRFSCTRLMIVALPHTDVQGAGDRERAMARMIEGLSQIVGAANGQGIDVYIENFSIPILPYSAVSDIERITDALPALKYTFDVGNFICVGENPHRAYERLRSRVSLLHLKNFATSQDGQGFPCADGHYVKGVPFDQGDFDMKCFLRACTTDGGRILPVIEHNAKVSLEAIARSAALTDQLLT